MQEERIQHLIQFDRAHVWHPFTPMRQWRQAEPLIIEAAEGDFLIDARDRRYIDGVSSLWCNVHGHRVPAIDRAVRTQLERVAHTTMLGLSNVPATELAQRLCAIAPGGLNKVFYSDAGATATELAFKMAMGYWRHRGDKQRDTFIALHGAYHGDTTGSMSVGYSPLFHKPFESMVFHTEFVDAPDVFHTEGTQGRRDEGTKGDPRPEERGLKRVWPLEDAALCRRVTARALDSLESRLKEKRGRIAAVAVEPIVQGAAGLIVQPPGYLKAVERLCREHDVLLIADEVATGFGRTGRMFACEHEGVEPDLMCLGKGLTGGYLPLAATLATEEIERAFCGELHEHKTLYHGHTYTGNPLACAAALASLDLFEQNDLLSAVNRKAALVADGLNPLRDAEKYPNVGDIRQRGLMIGIELVPPTGEAATGFDPSRRLGYEVCDACRDRGLIVRPLGNVVVLMPPLAIEEQNLRRMMDIVIETIGAQRS